MHQPAAEAVKLMERNIMGMLGALPSEAFDMSYHDIQTKSGPADGLRDGLRLFPAHRRTTHGAGKDFASARAVV